MKTSMDQWTSLASAHHAEVRGVPVHVHASACVMEALTRLPPCKHKLSIHYTITFILLYPGKK
jgi:hypothetical protein